MKRIAKLLLVSILFMSLFGCGDPTLDTSSDATRKSSAQAMAADLSPEDKETFKNALTGIYGMGMLAAALSGDSEEEAMAKIDAKVNGKTAKEIIALAEELKREMKKQ